MSNIDDLYRAPTTEVELAAELPESFLSGSMTVGKFRFLALLVLADLLLSLAGMWYSTLSSLEPGVQKYRLYAMVIYVAEIVVAIYLFLTLRRFLHQRFHFYRADRHILGLIVLYLAFAVVSIWLSISGEGGNVYVGLCVLAGVTMLLFGKRLLQIEEAYPGMKTYAWSIMISGLFVASVIGVYLSVIPSIVSSVALIVLYLAAAGELGRARRAADG